MQLVHSDSVFEVARGTQPNYNENNPLLRLSKILEEMVLAAERDHYLPRSVQYLVPFQHLDLYGPAGDDFRNLDPTRQDNKNDFQKQNLAGFIGGDTRLMRGWARAQDWSGPFLSLSYRGGPETALARLTQGQLGSHVRMFLKVGDTPVTEPLRVPYNPATDRYEVEIWAYPGNDLRGRLGAKGRDALDQGRILTLPGLVQGAMSDFQREGLDDRFLVEVAPKNTMHPVLPLHVEVAWADDRLSNWDSNGGNNYHYEFNMLLRGWDNYLGIGVSPNPHGGVGFLHYRNLLSNYGRYQGMRELGRQVEPWMFDASGQKSSSSKWENSLTVDYMDLHILKDNCGIGLHRHRDNSEAFFMMNGEALMVIGDWAKQPTRERCFEVRTLYTGHLAMLRGGQLHGLLNTTDENISLFMFGGYD